MTGAVSITPAIAPRTALTHQLEIDAVDMTNATDEFWTVKRSRGVYRIYSISCGFGDSAIRVLGPGPLRRALTSGQIVVY